MNMTPERWQEIEGLVTQALRLPGPERARFLVGRCSQDPAKLEQALDLLLASSEAEGIATPYWTPGDDSDPEVTPPIAVKQRPAVETEGEGQALGSFRVLGELGHGGMGIVYLAEQTSPVERRVAIKVAHSPLGSEGRLRLAAERQAMARLSHPNIAQVLEAGSTDDGHPYFAMELVEGAPITEYCDDRSLGVEARLQLFLAVCSGVQHAHQKGILHRDLKPSNILVADVDGTPVPKIIDFGIAKALDEPLLDHTLQTGRRIIGTPAYLSPEALSAGGRLEAADTRSDVYSLGVLLQELLIGERPFPEAPGETPLSHWHRKIDEEPLSLSRCWLQLDPENQGQVAERRGTRPRELGRRIRGELDWILLRALAREPGERYSGVSELATDLERHLAGEPVLAGPPTFVYQMRKLVQRHRLVVVFSCLLVLALAGGFVARSLEAARANRQTVEAQSAREETQRVVDFLVGLFGAADPRQALGEEPTARVLLEAGTARLRRRELEETPRVRARLFHTTAEVHLSLGDGRTGLPLAEEALAIRRRELAGDHPDVVASLVLVAKLEGEVGNYQRSEELLQDALGRTQVVHGERSLEAVEVLRHLGILQEETHRYDEALAYYDQALAISKQITGSESIEIADILNNIGVIHWRLLDYKEAEAHYRQALELRKQTLDPDHPHLATTFNNLGEVLGETGRYEEAHNHYQQAFAIRERVLGPNHPQLGITLNSMGDLQRKLGRWSQAEELFQQARMVWETSLGAEHDWVAYAFHNLGVVYYSQGRDEEALAMYRRALEIRRGVFEESNPIVVSTLALMGQSLRPLGRFTEAEQILAEAQAILEEAPGVDWFLFLVWLERGLIALERGQLETAASFFDPARAMAEEVEPTDSRLGTVMFAQARLAQARGQLEAATELARQSIPYMKIDIPEGHRRLVAARGFLAGPPP